MIAQLHFTHSVSIISGDFFRGVQNLHRILFGKLDLLQLVTLPGAFVLPELISIFSVVKCERHHAHLITKVVASTDRPRHLFALKF
jgi:hypothetical protein